MQQVSISGCNAECAESQWIMQLGLLERMAHCYIQAPILKHKGEETYICVLTFNAYCFYAVKYKICNPLVFLLKDISKYLSNFSLFVCRLTSHLSLRSPDSEDWSWVWYQN